MVGPQHPSSLTTFAARSGTAPSGRPFRSLRGIGATGSTRPDLVLVLEAQAQRQQDLPLGVHATVHALFDRMDRAQRHARLLGELRLGHEPILAELAHPISHALRLLA